MKISKYKQTDNNGIKLWMDSEPRKRKNENMQKVQWMEKKQIIKSMSVWKNVEVEE